MTRLAPLTVVTLCLSGAALLLTPLVAVGGVNIAGNGRVIALAVVVDLLSTALPFLLELTALRHVKAATYGVLLSIDPAIAALAGFVVLGQLLSIPEMVVIEAVTIAAAGAVWTSGAAGRGVDMPVA